MTQLEFEFYRAVAFGLANFSLGLAFGLWVAERRELRRLAAQAKQR